MPALNECLPPPPPPLPPYHKKGSAQSGRRVAVRGPHAPRRTVSLLLRAVPTLLPLFPAAGGGPVRQDTPLPGRFSSERGIAPPFVDGCWVKCFGVTRGG